MNKFELVINHTQEISEEKIQYFYTGLEKIKNNVPIQYITNHQEFMKLDFYVDENVLIPQPDTEILVEEVIKYAKQISRVTTNLQILDLCTGSGAIAISLAKYIPNCEIIATDVSQKALQVANINAENNLVQNKIDFIKSDMFEGIPKKDFDIIVSNPPYIETDTISKLSQEVQNEPTLALDGGIDGLDFYRTIIDDSHTYLSNGGKLFLEIGYNQKNALFNLAKESTFFSDCVCIKDLSGNDRVIILGTPTKSK